jgi:hypothetical protein
MKGKGMRKLFLLAIAVMAIFIGACSNKAINHNPPGVITVGVVPAADTISFGDSLKFYANVYSTNVRAVDWFVNNISNGNDSLGNIITINDTSAWYKAPFAGTEITFDSIVVKAVSRADSTKSGLAIARILSQNVVFVDSTLGNDAHGIGSIFHPYRTITKGISKAGSNDTVYVGPGTYGTGETFPLTLPFTITVHGAGIDSTRVTAPASVNPVNAAFYLRNDQSMIEDLSIVGLGNSGIGVYTSSILDTSTAHIIINNILIIDCKAGAIVTSVSHNLEFRNGQYDNCNYGIKVIGDSSYAVISNTKFTDIDSICILADSGATIQLTDNAMTNGLYGVKIGLNSDATIKSDTLDNFSVAGVHIDSAGGANLGQIGAFGNNVFRNFSSGSWCIYNSSLFDVYAVYNTWPATDSATIDNQYIYDTSEDSTRGVVYFMPIHP